MKKPLVVTDTQIAVINKMMREQGLFATTGTNPPNPMGVHWGSIGYMWNRWVFCLPVRYNKLSHDIIEQTKEFTISVPYKDLRYYMVKLDNISGREHDKFTELHLHAKKAKKVGTYIVDDCDLHLECKVIYTSNMGPGDLDPMLKNDMYSTKNFHTMYFGEIVDIYEH
ncbi:MAG: flavin reductase [Firmicutes bacterium]|nr:flavin reductase [Bacillota bacterium]